MRGRSDPMGQPGTGLLPRQGGETRGRLFALCHASQFKHCRGYTTKPFRQARTMNTRLMLFWFIAVTGCSMPGREPHGEPVSGRPATALYDRGDALFISSISETGAWIGLDDGSTWVVADPYKPRALEWKPGAKVEVHPEAVERGITVILHIQSDTAINTTLDHRPASTARLTREKLGEEDRERARRGSAARSMQAQLQVQRTTYQAAPDGTVQATTRQGAALP